MLDRCRLFGHRLLFGLLQHRSCNLLVLPNLDIWNLGKRYKRSHRLHGCAWPKGNPNTPYHLHLNCIVLQNRFHKSSGLYCFETYRRCILYRYFCQWHCCIGPHCIVYTPFAHCSPHIFLTRNLCNWIDRINPASFPQCNRCTIVFLVLFDTNPVYR